MFINVKDHRVFKKLDIEGLLAKEKDYDALRARVARLEEALKEARLQIEYLHGKFQETGSGNAVLARIDRALEEK